jgi:hypothetical protein
MRNSTEARREGVLEIRLLQISAARAESLRQGESIQIRVWLDGAKVVSASGMGRGVSRTFIASGSEST